MASKKVHGKSKAMQIQSTLVPTATVPKGIMVSPGRYVNLAKGPATLEERMRASIKTTMRKARFQFRTARCEDMILECILTARHYREHPHFSHAGIKVTRLSFGTSRSNDRNQEGIRFYLIGMLWYAWVIGTGEKPIVNNRRNPDLPFVTFVKSIAPWFGLGNVIKNLERFQSFRKRTLQGKIQIKGANRSVVSALV
jgi:hypothetical protein